MIYTTMRNSLVLINILDVLGCERLDCRGRTIRERLRDRGSGLLLWSTYAAKLPRPRVPTRANYITATAALYYTHRVIAIFHIAKTVRMADGSNALQLQSVNSLISPCIYIYIHGSAWFMPNNGLYKSALGCFQCRLESSLAVYRAYIIRRAIILQS